MFTDPSGEFAILTFIIVSFVITIATHGAMKAYQTAKSLGSEGWELAGYTASGLILGDYLPVKDNWDEISQSIDPGVINGQINFDFNSEGNVYYSMYTAGLYASYLKENLYSNRSDRTPTGMYIELQFHYGFYKIDAFAGGMFNGGNPFFGNGNPAYLGVPDWSGDWTAATSEFIAELLYGISNISPIY